MSDIPQRHFRVSVCRMVFAEMELTAPTPLAAESIAQTAPGANVTFETRTIVHRIEERAPVSGKPGEFQWVKVRAGV